VTITTAIAPAPSAEALAARERIRAEARERVRLEDIARAKDVLYEALHPAPRHGRAALECLEVDDDIGLVHHLDRFFAAAKAAWAARAALKDVQSVQSKGEAA
jgi:hypothetical protein